jgi:DNA polymerase-3 subunit beta
MRMNIVNAQLAGILQHVIGVADPRAPLPVLSHVLLYRHGQSLRACATDSEVELEAQHRLDEKGEDFRVLVQARRFYEILKSFPEDSVFQLSQDPSQDRIQMHSGKSRFVIATLPAEDFPLMRQEAPQGVLQIPADRLLALFRATSYAMAQNDGRHYLNGMLFTLRDGRLRAVATDGHRLALDETEVGASGENVNLVLPRKAVLETEKILSSLAGEEKVTIAFGENMLRFEVKDLRLSCKIMPGKDYPDYERVIPVAADKSFIFDIKNLYQSIKHARALVGERYAAVNFHLSGGVLRVFARNKQNEISEEMVDVEQQGGDIEISFNADYVLESLDSIRGERATFRMTSSAASSLVEPSVKSQEEKQVSVIMPLRV